MAPNKLGTLALKRRRRTRWLLGLVILVVVALLGAAAIVSARGGESPLTSPDPIDPIAEPALIDPSPQVQPLPTDAPIPDKQAVRAAISAATSPDALATFAGSVSDAVTGDQLWGSSPDRALVPASTTKIVTASAALLALAPDHRLITKVVRGDSDGQIVLVGGGDPTLSAQPLGTPSFYAGAGRLDDLVEQLRTADVRPRSVVVDTSAYTGSRIAEGWSTADIPGGYIAPMQSIMIDGARLGPGGDAPRSDTPALDAGRALAEKLGIDPERVTSGAAPDDAEIVAQVQSAPLSVRLADMLVNSDNVLAEAVGREIAMETDHEPSFTGAIAAVRSVLADVDIDTGSAILRDLSGLSSDNRISARLLDSLMVLAAGPDQPKLRPLLDDLPVAGGTGTLSDRYGGPQKSAAGWVRAKTGTLAAVSALVGYVVDRDGRVLTFALLSNGESPVISRPALDDVVLALRSCGCRA